MLKIAVIGNCTARGIGNCLRLLRPRDRITSYFLEQDFDLGAERSERGPVGALLKSVSRVAPPTLRRRLRLPKSAIADLARIEFDYAFASAHLDGSDSMRFLRSRRPVIYWPNLIFVGYQPDCMYFAVNGKVVRTPMHDYNSRIAAAGYAAGLSVRDTARLFNKLVYARLGFFEKFELSKAALAQEFDHYGYDLAAEIAVWMKHAPFMYSINHPKLIVCASIARQALGKAGLHSRDVDSTASVADHMAGMGIWPVYPELGESMGIQGSTRFTIPSRKKQPGQVATLAEFIEGSFGRYDKDGYDRDNFARDSGIAWTIRTMGL